MIEWNLHRSRLNLDIKIVFIVTVTFWEMTIRKRVISAKIQKSHKQKYLKKLPEKNVERQSVALKGMGKCGINKLSSEDIELLKPSKELLPVHVVPYLYGHVASSEHICEANLGHFDGPDSPYLDSGCEYFGSVENNCVFMRFSVDEFDSGHCETPERSDFNDSDFWIENGDSDLDSLIGKDDISLVRSILDEPTTPDSLSSEGSSSVSNWYDDECDYPSIFSELVAVVKEEVISLTKGFFSTAPTGCDSPFITPSEVGSDCESVMTKSVRNAVDKVQPDLKDLRITVVEADSKPVQGPCLKGESGRKKASDKARDILLDWVAKHTVEPYPNKGEKEMLAKQTGLSVIQVVNWMSNTRKRFVKPLLLHSHEPDTKIGRTFLDEIQKRTTTGSSTGEDISINNV